jgi:hypothetical protein
MQFSQFSSHCLLLVDSNIYLITLFSDTSSPSAPQSARDHVAQSYKTTGKIIALFILIFAFYMVNNNNNNINNNKYYVPKCSRQSQNSMCL